MDNMTRNSTPRTQLSSGSKVRAHDVYAGRFRNMSDVWMRRQLHTLLCMGLWVECLQQICSRHNLDNSMLK